MIYRQYLDSLAVVPLNTDHDEASSLTGRRVEEGADGSSIDLTYQKQIAAILELYFSEGELVDAALEYASSIEHIMDSMKARALNTLFSLLNKTVCNILEYNSQRSMGSSSLPAHLLCTALTLGSKGIIVNHLP